MSLPSSASSVVGDKRLWDITTRFRQAASCEDGYAQTMRVTPTDPLIALPVGVLIKDETFTLFESVGALEVTCDDHDLRTQTDQNRSWIRRWTADASSLAKR